MIESQQLRWWLEVRDDGLYKAGRTSFPSNVLGANLRGRERIEGRVEEVEGGMEEVEGRMEGVEGRMEGQEERGRMERVEGVEGRVKVTKVCQHP